MFGKIFNKFRTNDPEKQERSEEGNRRLQVWHEKYQTWHNQFNKNSDYADKVIQLKKSIGTEVAAEERVSMEKFCELAVTVPKTGITERELLNLGFTIYDSPLESVWIVKYPDGWNATPENPNREDSTGSRWAKIQDDRGQKRMTVFWQDSSTGGKPLTARVSAETNTEK